MHNKKRQHSISPPRVRFANPTHGSTQPTDNSGLSDCGDAVDQIVWYFVDVHQMHEQMQFKSDAVFDRQPM